MATPFRLSRQTVRVLAEFNSDPGEWLYGYPLSQATGLASGTLYPILQRLFEHRWLERKWGNPDQPGRPPRQLYRLTSLGAREARAIFSPSKKAARLRTLREVPA
jgi:PadR family transcriptional regulator PadR